MIEPSRIARWVVGCAAAVALAFVTVPPLAETAGSAIGAESFATAEGGAPAFCDGKNKQANLAFTLKDMHGKDVRLSDYKGKVILLNFWATWCGPCKYEIPAFVELQTKYKDQGFVVLGVSTDDPPDKLRTFAQQYKMNYPVLQGRDRTDLVDDAFGPMWGIPVSFFIAKNGTICKRHMGLATKEQLDKEIKALLAT
jgi:cytochrome c biogenesis protein CcmG/thiol:disulfide interchange protein DsbE